MFVSFAFVSTGMRFGFVCLLLGSMLVWDGRHFFFLVAGQCLRNVGAVERCALFPQTVWPHFVAVRVTAQCFIEVVGLVWKFSCNLKLPHKICSYEMCRCVSTVRTSTKRVSGHGGPAFFLNYRAKWLL